MNVLVNGVGNIGTTLLNVLSVFKNELGIDKIYALKNTFYPSQHADLTLLQERGIIVTSHDKPYVPFSSIVHDVHYVFDCTSNQGLKNKAYYN